MVRRQSVGRLPPNQNLFRNTMDKLIIATRGSALALWQANHIKSLIERNHHIPVELSIIKTKGDIILDVPLAQVGGKGLFVKEIEESLLSGEADLAVHSIKDVPMDLPEGLVLAAVPEREDPADLLLSMRYVSLAELPEGAKVGTSSLRRQAQLLGLRPDLRVVSLRGNVDTRLRKLTENQFDAIVMAASGMKRLGLSASCSSRLAPPEFLPAVGQGALGIECRADRADVLDLVRFLDHEETRLQIEAERGFSARLNGGCQAPIAAYARYEDGGLVLEGLIAALDGSEIIRRKLRQLPGQSPRALGAAAAELALEAGGETILRHILQTTNPAGQD